AAGARGGECILCGCDKSRRIREAVEHRRVLRTELLLRSAGTNRGASLARQGRAHYRRSRSRQDQGSAKRVAVLPRSQAGDLRRPLQALRLEELQLKTTSRGL